MAASIALHGARLAILMMVGFGQYLSCTRSRVGDYGQVPGA